MPRSRRTLLKSTALALSTGPLASIAGCLSSRPLRSGNDQHDPSRTDRPDETGSPAFTDWLPDPSTTLLRDGYGVRYFDIASIRAHQDAIHDNAYDRLETAMRRPVPNKYIDVANVEASVAIDHVMRFALGSFDPEAFGERLTSDDQSSTDSSSRSPTTATRTPWSEPERYQGFDLYGSEYVYAVSEDAVMEVSPMGEGGDAIAHVKAIIDAPRADTSQYVDANEYAAAMLGIDDAPHAVWCYPEAMDGSTSRGFRDDRITGGLKSWLFDAETTSLTFANTYADAETATRAKLEAYIEDESDRFGSYDGLDVMAEERMVWTEGTIPTNEFDFLAPGGPSDGVHTPN